MVQGVFRIQKKQDAPARRRIILLSFKVILLKAKPLRVARLAGIAVAAAVLQDQVVLNPA